MNSIQYFIIFFCVIRFHDLFIQNFSGTGTGVTFWLAQYSTCPFLYTHGLHSPCKMVYCTTQGLTQISIQFVYSPPPPMCTRKWWRIIMLHRDGDWEPENWCFDTSVRVQQGVGLGPRPLAYQAIFVPSPFPMKVQCIVISMCPIPSCCYCKKFSIILIT